MSAGDRPTAASGPTWLVWPITLLLAIVGGAAVLQNPKSSDDAKPPAPAKAADAPAERPPDFDPLRLVQEYFQYAGEEGSDEKPVLDVRVHAAVAADGFRLKIDRPPAPRTLPAPPVSLPARLPPFQFESLVVSVPDPVDSKFAYEFDGTVQAIQWAFQARGMILHSSLLPWKRGPDGKPEGDLHRRYPGALLFRRIRKENIKDGETSGELEHPHLYHRVVCLVLLVGENPISGPHKQALARALTAVEDLRSSVTVHRFSGILPGSTRHGFWPPWTEPIAVVGPYYSGSASILKNTLRSWRAKWGGHGDTAFPRFRLISGSATGVNPANLFNEPWCTFQATVVQTDLLNNAVLDFLARGPGGEVLPSEGLPGIESKMDRSDRRKEQDAKITGLGPVAILRESNTGFGSSEGDRRQRAADAKETLDQKKTASGFIDLPFPASISQLKVDLEKLPTTTTSAVPTLPTEFAAPRLPLKDDYQLDGVPLQDRDSSVALSAQSLRAIVETIDREGVRVVGITATDDRDVVFLNRLLKKHCPTVRVFATGPSMVMAMPAEAYHMRGTVFGSTYPLFPSNQGWVDERAGRRLPFLGHSAQGIHNAVLAQFGEYDKLVEYRSPNFGQKSISNARPPIWVSVIGQNGDLVPVRVYSDYDDRVQVLDEKEKPLPVPERYVFELPANERAAAWQPPVSPRLAASAEADNCWALPSVPLARLTVTPSRGFLLLLGLLAVAAVATAVNAASPWRAWYLFNPALSSGPEVVARVLVWAAGTMALIACLPVLGALRFDRDGSGTWLLAAGLVLVIIVSAITTVIALVREALRKEHAGRRGRNLGFLAAATVVAAGATIAAGVWGLTGDHDRRFLWLVRASDLTTGLSPLLPTILLATAVAALALFRLKQAAVLGEEEVRVECPFPEAEDKDPWKGVVPLDQQTRNLFGGWTWAGKAAARPQTYFVLVPFLVFGSWFCAVVHRTAETAPWDVIWRVGFWLTGTLVGLTLVRLLTLWAGVRRLLDKVAELPMAAAFERLPDKVSRMFHGYLYTERPRGYEEVAAQQLAAAGERVEGVDKKKLHNYATGFVTSDLPRLWASRTVNDAYGRSERPDPPTGEDPHPRETFVALMTVVYLSQFFVGLRTLVWSLTIAAPLLLLAAASYPFQPERPLLYALMALLGAVVVGILYVLYDLNRNELVSRITKTTPNRFTLDRGFLMSVGQYILPVLGVAALYLAGAFRVIVEPLLSALR